MRSGGPSLVRGVETGIDIGARVSIRTNIRMRTAVRVGIADLRRVRGRYAVARRVWRREAIPTAVGSAAVRRGHGRVGRCVGRSTSDARCAACAAPTSSAAAARTRSAARATGPGIRCSSAGTCASGFSA